MPKKAPPVAPPDSPLALTKPLAHLVQPEPKDPVTAQFLKERAARATAVRTTRNRILEYLKS